MQKRRKEIKSLVFAALMTALCVVIGWVCKSYLTLTPQIRITFENLPILLVGFVLGPAYGAAAGAISDIISCLLSGYGINPIITLGSAEIGAIAGIFSGYVNKGKSFPKTLAVCMLAHFAGSMVTKSAGMMIMYGAPFAVVAFRIPLYIGIAAVESYFVWLLLKNKKISEFGR